MLKKEFSFERGDEAAALQAFYESCPNPAVPAVPPKKEPTTFRREIGCVATTQSAPVFVHAISY